MGFREPRAAVEIELATDREAYLPGEDVRARVRLIPREDVADVECSVALVHVGRFGAGDSSWVDDRAVAGEYVISEENLRAGVPGEWTAVLPVPRRITPPQHPEDCADDRYPPSGEDADPESYDIWIEPDERWGPPTSVHPEAASAWLVRAEIAGQAAMPEGVEVPVIVLAPVADMPADPPNRVGDGTPRCSMSFSGLPRTSVRPGTTLRGTVRITAREELTARGVRVELVRVVATTAARGSSTTGTVVASVEASGEVGLRPRQPRDVAFSVEVPADAGPSVVGEEHRIDWALRAVLDLPWKRDEVWEQRIAVHTAP